MKKKHKIIIAVTGASGAIYAKVLFDKLLLLNNQIETVGVILSDNAKFDNFVFAMINTKFFKENDDNFISASKITKKAKIGYEQFFDKEFITFIDKQLA